METGRNTYGQSFDAVPTGGHDREPRQRSNGRTMTTSMMRTVDIDRSGL